MKSAHLLKPAKPCLHLFIGTDSEALDFLGQLSLSEKNQVVCRVVRGHKAQAAGPLFDEIAAALQFPPYFGENWDALDECLTDLEWLPGKAYIIAIAQGIRILEREPLDQMKLLVSVFERAAQEWGQPVAGEGARPARAFHVVFQCTRAEEKALRDKLNAAQASFDLLE